MMPNKAPGQQPLTAKFKRLKQRSLICLVGALEAEKAAQPPFLNEKEKGKEKERKVRLKRSKQRMSVAQTNALRCSKLAGCARKARKACVPAGQSMRAC